MASGSKTGGGNPVAVRLRPSAPTSYPVYRNGPIHDRIPGLGSRPEVQGVLDRSVTAEIHGLTCAAVGAGTGAR
ncbi:MAG TPA: hypothetical protein EYN14_07975 [Alphaproteobacteria bacterium]|nr:hypothetical protein [Alphaproteobacteria bacterium]